MPHKAVIALGPVKLDLHVEPMIDEFGDYLGAVVLWGISTQQSIDALRKAQEAQRNDVEHLNGNLQMVATATHELEASIAEIAKNATDLARQPRSRERRAREQSFHPEPAVILERRGQGGGTDCLHRHANQRAGVECEH